MAYIRDFTVYLLTLKLCELKFATKLIILVSYTLFLLRYINDMKKDKEVLALQVKVIGKSSVIFSCEAHAKFRSKGVLTLCIE